MDQLEWIMMFQQEYGQQDRCKMFQNTCQLSRPDHAEEGET